MSWVRFEALEAVFIMLVFWDVMTCRMIVDISKSLVPLFLGSSVSRKRTFRLSVDLVQVDQNYISFLRKPRTDTWVIS